MVIEVDGPHHRALVRRADDGNRDLQWNRCGVPVVRLPVEDLADDKKLDDRLAEGVPPSPASSTELRPRQP